MFFLYANISPHNLNLCLDSQETRFLRNIFGAVQKTRSTNNTRPAFLYSDKTPLLVFYTFHEVKQVDVSCIILLNHKTYNLEKGLFLLLIFVTILNVEVLLKMTRHILTDCCFMCFDGKKILLVMMFNHYSRF